MAKPQFQQVGTIGYPCQQCEQTFETAEDFSNHFRRDGATIIGCQRTPAAVKTLRRPE